MATVEVILAVKTTSTQIFQTSVIYDKFSFQNYSHPDDPHTIRAKNVFTLKFPLITPCMDNAFADKCIYF